MKLLLIVICAILIGFIIGYILTNKKINSINKDIEQKNQNIQQEYNKLQEQFNEEKIRQQQDINDWENKRNKKFLDWKNTEADLASKISALDTEIKEKKRIIQELSKNTSIIESQTYDLAVSSLESKEKELYTQYKKLEEELLIHYQELANSEMGNFIQQNNELSNKILEQENKLQELQQKINSIVESNKRIELEKQQKDFYRLQLSDLDIEEIKKIRSIEPYLRQKEPLNKVIWKVYYEKPYTALIGRVIGNKKITGIYKITNLENGMCYVGQSVDIAERWKQHIKRGIGADPATQNKLYPAMLEQGVENFTFELLEECPGVQLTEREKFYTDFYKAQEYGYSIKKG